MYKNNVVKCMMVLLIFISFCTSSCIIWINSVLSPISDRHVFFFFGFAQFHSHSWRLEMMQRTSFFRPIWLNSICVFLLFYESCNYWLTEIFYSSTWEQVIERFRCLIIELSVGIGKKWWDHQKTSAIFFWIRNAVFIFI